MADLAFERPYDPAFLGDGFTVPLPTPRCTGQLLNDGRPLDYIHYSLVMHAERNAAVFAASNVDRASWVHITRGSDPWSTDPRAGSHQIPGIAYKYNPWDRGHLVRRAAVTFGGVDVARDAEEATFFYTNAHLQHRAYNQDEWLHLEEWVLDRATDFSPRLCVFAGPLYTLQDEYTPLAYRIPAAFWKVIVLRDPAVNGADLAVATFLMKQNTAWDVSGNGGALDLKVYQVPLADVGAATGLDFGPLTALDEFEWRRGRFRDGRGQPWIPVSGPEDIVFPGAARRRAAGLRARGSAPQPRAELDHGCGCGTQPTALQVEVQALREMVETLADRLAQASPQDRDRMTRLRNRLGRIVGGVSVPSGGYPECACIGSPDGAWFCTGVLIAPNVVLTAAHCAPPGIGRVMLASNSIAFADQPDLAELIEVEDVIVHPDYDPRALPSHDIAIVILKTDATRAQPIPLATTAEVEAATSCQIVGFGNNHPTRPIGFGTKRETEVSVVEYSQVTPTVEAIAGFDRTAEFYAVDAQQMRDTCNGDSGGPAYIFAANGDLKLAGLTSRAAADSLVPCSHGGIYTRVDYYADWIAASLGGGSAALDLKITAVLPNPAGSDRDREWFEVTNRGAAPAVLDGVVAKARGNKRFSLSGGILPGATRRFFPQGRVALSNSGATLRLERDGQTVASATWPKAKTDEVYRFEDPAPAPTDVVDRWQADPC